MSTFNPILNNPFEEPRFYYQTDADGNLNHNEICQGRRPFVLSRPPLPVPQAANRQLFGLADIAGGYETEVVNLVRKEVGAWRTSGYVGTTRITKVLLDYWFNPERINKLFFVQRESIEAAIWLNEVAPKSNVGTNVLKQLEKAQIEGTDATFNLNRIAFKMATGTGKTVVMAALVLYHFFNREEYRNDTRFADNFLIVAPGITIKDRLNVLLVDTDKRGNLAQDYYRVRNLVPPQFEESLPKLNGKLVITNYHSFEPKVLQGNKRSPFDGKGGNKAPKEEYNQTIKRILGGFKVNSRLLIINDEAHHCYLPRIEDNKKPKSEDIQDINEENRKAAVWITGLSEVSKRFKVTAVYDLSATPYYLAGSGYPPYTLFPWVVTDFGLIEAIESGLVKIPFLPEKDSSHELEEPKLRNLYEHIKDDLPKKGKKGQRKSGESEQQGEPQLPKLLRVALDQFYDHYRSRYDTNRSLFERMPVFIIVCNNTSLSEEVFRYVAGYEIGKEDSGQTTVVPSKFPLFSNFHPQNFQPESKPPTLLIDSEALARGDQMDDALKKILAPEIQRFKQEYSRVKGAVAAEKITDSELLREVLNTVGKKGALGEHIRCVVSVNMLTEGWDANTVTHICGIRAFGSQLLCEQVAGRALRRIRYEPTAYRLESDGSSPVEIPESERHKYKPENIIWKYPPEYAHIIGVPFKLFSGSATPVPPAPTREVKQVVALPERSALEIRFPNVVGYKVNTVHEPIRADFSKVHPYELDGSKLPVVTQMGNAFSPLKENLTLETAKQIRRQELVYNLTRHLISTKFRDESGHIQIQHFPSLKEIVIEWLETRVKLIHNAFEGLLIFENEGNVVNHIMQGIDNAAIQDGREQVVTILNYHNRYGSTKYVRGSTTREVYGTIHSHVNWVVADTNSWEQIAAKTLDELAEEGRVISYVKNAFLGFAIPYVQEGKENPQYYPDFLVRCKASNGTTFNLILEITGMNQDKAEKRWYVEQRWLAGINAIRHTLPDSMSDEWRFAEVSNDIRDISNQLKAIIN